LEEELVPHVVVIGAGVVGASVAYRLAKAGVQVTVLEATRPAGGTSSNSFAWANANDKPPLAYHRLNHAGLREHHDLVHELGGSWFFPTGNLELAVDPERRAYLRAKVARLQAWGYRAELVGEDRARQLAPDLRLPEAGTADYAHYSEEGWVAAPVLIHRLLEAAQSAGAQLIYPARVSRLDFDGSQVTGVIANDTRYPADVVVDCAGPAAGDLLAPLGLAFTRERSPGLLLSSEALPIGLNLIHHRDEVHLRPDGAGRLRFGSRLVDEQLPADGQVSPDSPLVAEILRRATEAVPILEGAKIEGIRVGWRPLPADGLSAVGPISGLGGYYLVCTHSGVTLGPLLGRLVTQEIVSARERPELAAFRPERLVGRGRT
jgi:glycine/D-amino acid oxidase-like deaminating enzyme